SIGVMKDQIGYLKTANPALGNDRTYTTHGFGVAVGKVHAQQTIRFARRFNCSRGFRIIPAKGLLAKDPKSTGKGGNRLRGMQCIWRGDHGSVERLFKK